MPVTGEGGGGAGCVGVVVGVARAGAGAGGGGGADVDGDGVWANAIEVASTAARNTKLRMGYRGLIGAAPGPGCFRSGGGPTREKRGIVPRMSPEHQAIVMSQARGTRSPFDRLREESAVDRPC